jgi:hypothetical protein
VTWFFRKLKWLAQRRAKESELQDELQFHLDEEAADLQSRGLSSTEARSGAHRDLGNLALVQEDMRAAWTWVWMEQFAQDVRYALRAMAASKGFHGFAIFSLALGIGANTAIFSIVDAVLLRQLPYRQPEQLAWIWATRTDRDKAFFSIPNFIDTRDRQRAFAQLAAFSNWGANLTGSGEPERLSGVRLSAGALKMLGVRAAAGRTLFEKDDKPTNALVVMFSYGFWQRRFGGNTKAIGQAHPQRRAVHCGGRVATGFYDSQCGDRSSHSIAVRG